MLGRLHGPCWVITDEAAGNQRQAWALAERLQLPVHHRILQPRPPWSWLSPRLTAAGRLALRPAQQRLFAPPWPSVAIGCGRAAALFTRLLRPLSGGACYTVQILDPHIDPAHWDMVIAPRHDRLEGPNVLTPVGSLNPVDDAWLQDGRDAFPQLGALPRPRVGVLLGGPRKDMPFDAGQAKALAERLLARQHKDGGSLMVVASRRTPAEVVGMFRDVLKGDVPARLWASRADGPNPYPGVLGWADRLVVTPDSVNMLSEACAVGCPVETLVLARLPPRIERFHRALRASRHLYDLDASPTAAEPAPLRETAEIARLLKQRLAVHQANG